MLTQQVQKIKLQSIAKRFLADTTTPVSIYMKIRDHFESSLLLESTDFRSAENCFSFICMEPIASFEVTGKKLQTLDVDGKKASEDIATNDEIPGRLNHFMNQFDIKLQRHQWIFWIHEFRSSSIF